MTVKIVCANKAGFFIIHLFIINVLSKRKSQDSLNHLHSGWRNECIVRVLKRGFRWSRFDRGLIVGRKRGATVTLRDLMFSVMEAVATGTDAVELVFSIRVNKVS